MFSVMTLGSLEEATYGNTETSIGLPVDAVYIGAEEVDALALLDVSDTSDVLGIAAGDPDPIEAALENKHKELTHAKFKDCDASIGAEVHVEDGDTGRNVNNDAGSNTDSDADNNAEGTSTIFDQQVIDVDAFGIVADTVADATGVDGAGMPLNADRIFGID